MLNTGAFALKVVRGVQKWPLKRGSRLIEVAATTVLTVVKCRIDEVKLGEQYYATIRLSISSNVNFYQELAYLTFILRNLMFIFSTIEVRS